MLATESIDLLVVGGGINGTGIARDAAGRGLSVLLCEQHDLAAHTSSSSTKLIHGGLRYVEQLEFNLVRKALQEREVLLGSAPHIISPLRFIMPHDSTLRPAWMIRVGLFLYDHLATRKRLPASRSVDLRTHESGAPLRADYRRGFAYSDGWVDDARLVVLAAKDAAERGARVLTRTRCERLSREGSNWRAQLVDAQGSVRQITARAVVNAAGPWVAQFLQHASPIDSTHSVRLVKGSHIVVPRLFDHPYAYIFQNPDKRIIFAIPYEESFTLIGTTDVEYAGRADAVAIDRDEIAYLCAMASRYFTRSIAPSDVVWTYSGVRPLLDDESSDPMSVTRDYALELDDDGAPILSVFGGKITTFRKLAEEAVDRLVRALGLAARPWTSTAQLPGGDLPDAGFDEFVRSLRASYPWLADPLRARFARAYGTRTHQLVQGASGMHDLGAAVLPGLHEREIGYLVREEWARTAEDILWRRTKLGLHLPDGSARILDDWLARAN